MSAICRCTILSLVFCWFTAHCVSRAEQETGVTELTGARRRFIGRAITFHVLGAHNRRRVTARIRQYCTL